jgi:hypothetical protein
MIKKAFSHLIITWMLFQSEASLGQEIKQLHPTLQHPPVSITPSHELQIQEFSFLKEDKKTEKIYDNIIDYINKTPEYALQEKILELASLKNFLEQQHELVESENKNREFISLLNRIYARQSYLKRLSKIVYKVENFQNKLQNNLYYSKAIDDSLIEDFILAWNPGNYPQESLKHLAAEYKSQKNIKDISLERAYRFYCWADNVLNKKQKAYISPSLIKACQQEFLKPSQDSRKVHFSNEGTAHVGYLAYHASTDKILKNIIKPLEDAELMYVYPLKQQKYLYAINTKGELYILEMYKGGHVDILKGKDVICAGELIFKDQKIYAMDPMSGHYLSTKKDLEDGYTILAKRYGQQIFHSEFFLSPYSEITTL